MPVCQICGQSLKVINANHLRQHGITLEQYIVKYGDPNKAALGSRRPSTSVQAVKLLADQKEKKAKSRMLTAPQERSLDDLYKLEETIVVPRNFYWVDQNNPEILDLVIELIKEYGEVSVDTETTGLDVFRDELTHLVLTPSDPGRNYNIVIPLYHVDREDKVLPNLLPRDYVVSKVKPILEDERIRTNWFNLYYDWFMVKQLGIRVANIVPERYRPRFDGRRMIQPTWDKAIDKWDGGWDGYIAAHILMENEPSYRLKDLYAKYLHKSEPNEEIRALGVESFEELFNKIKFFRVPKKVATCYACKDGHITRRLKEFQKPYIDSVGSLDRILYTIEFPQIEPLCEMREHGIAVNLETAKKIGVELGKKRDEALAKVYAEVGQINLNSPKQVAHAFYDELGLPDLNKGTKRERSTRAEVLEELAELGYDVAQNLVDYRKMDKLITSFIDPIEQMLGPDGRIHSKFNQNGTKTGRYSSSEPNMQQMPNRYGIVRTMITADPGEVLIGGDFSQIEPRLMAHTCEDEAMVQAYRDDKDLYSVMASRIFSFIAEKLAGELNSRLGSLDMEDPVHGLSPIRQQLFKDEFVYLDGGKFKPKPLTPDDCVDGTLYRKVMKTLMLAMGYGMTDFGLARRLKIDEAEAHSIFSDFYDSFLKLKLSIEAAKRFAFREGYVETAWGRKRRIDDVWSDQRWIRRKAERKVFNSIIQGGAADMMKIAMLLVWYDPRLKDLGFKMRLTVHDELIGSVPKQNAFKAAQLMIEDMIGCAELLVPLKVDAEIYLTGEWNADSASVKFKNGKPVLIYKDQEVNPRDLGLAD